MFDLFTALDFAKQLASESGKIALKYFGFNTSTSWKADDTPLTKADSEINDFIIAEIRKRFPDHSILGEEKSAKKNDADYIWVCDPIDGTIAFSCGLPIFVFSLALVEKSNGQPLLGVIYDPVMKTMYWGHKGGNAYRDGTKIEVLKSTSLTHGYFNTGATGKSINFSPFPLYTYLAQRKCKSLKLPSFIYGAVQVPNGKFTGAVFYHTSAHDVAALKIITEEAGGQVTDLNGNERRYDEDGIGCIVSNRVLHQNLVEIIQTGKL